MTSEIPTTVDVFLDAADLGPSRQVGRLRNAGSGLGLVIAFAYDPSWLADPISFELDPSLQLYGGDQYTKDGALAGIFTDAAPDRWGRTLIERREAATARELGRRRRVLQEWDFLLGVNDGLRMGGLRFAAPDGRFLDDDPLMVPPTASLRELEGAVDQVEHPRRGAKPEDTARLALLLAPGSSLGGARPKTSFTLEDGSLWIAKFPSRNDRHDVGAWEYVLNQLAARAGIEVPETRLLELSGEHRTFAAKRFDREGESRRLYASALTLVGKRDRDPASYPELALAIADNGAPERIDDDLAQLYRRVVFNILVGHRDDHLRNHGFLRTPQGWRLSPAFDLNPMPTLTEHQLAIDGFDHAPDLRLAEQTADFYRLSPAEARRIIDGVKEAVAAWERVAHDSDVSPDEIDLLRATFAV